jgi:hypothetical protein
MNQILTCNSLLSHVRRIISPHYNPTRLESHYLHNFYHYIDEVRDESGTKVVTCSGEGRDRKKCTLFHHFLSVFSPLSPAMLPDPNKEMNRFDIYIGIHCFGGVDAFVFVVGLNQFDQVNQCLVVVENKTMDHDIMMTAQMCNRKYGMIRQ